MVHISPSACERLRQEGVEVQKVDEEIRTKKEADRIAARQRDIEQAQEDATNYLESVTYEELRRCFKSPRIQPPRDYPFPSAEYENFVRLSKRSGEYCETFYDTCHTAFQQVSKDC